MEKEDKRLLSGCLFSFVLWSISLGCITAYLCHYEHWWQWLISIGLIALGSAFFIALFCWLAYKIFVKYVFPILKEQYYTLCSAIQKMLNACFEHLHSLWLGFWNYIYKIILYILRGILYIIKIFLKNITTHD